MSRRSRKARPNARWAKDAMRRADLNWLAEGGLERAHTKMGVATARRLLDAATGRQAHLRAYIDSAPKQMPVTDYEADGGKIIRPSRKRPVPRLPYHEVSGGLPGLGKRR